MAALYVPMSWQLRDALIAWAAAEHRPVRDHVVWLLEQAVAAYAQPPMEVK